MHSKIKNHPLDLSHIRESEADQRSSNNTVVQLALNYELKLFSFWIKRLIDYLLAVLIFLCVAPLIAIIAILIRLDSPGSAIFRQIRVGRYNRHFTIYKFRTMMVGSDKSGIDISKDDPRITRVGHFLRNTSLDELPQLFNVLKGDMSLIGPRPTLPEQVAQYSHRQMIRLRGLPGVTNLPAVSGRNEISWNERIELDITYLKEWSLWLDMQILWKTIWVVIHQQGIYGADGRNSDFHSEQ